MIHDVHTRTLSLNQVEGQTSVEIHRFGAELLPRIGLIEWIEFVPERASDLQYVTVAHEVWAVVAGECNLTLHDPRLNSPSQGEQAIFEIAPRQAILIPRGIELSLSCRQPVHLLRLASEAVPFQASTEP